MGFFSKLFEKKECAICGGEIGLLGNRKLEDGNMCKDCAAKLSPWFSDRRNSTVQEINEQLAYREQNQAELRSFHVSKTFGKYYKVYVEENAGVPTRFVVTRENDYVEDNADIISFKDVTSCNIDIQEHKEEMKRRNDDGEYVSYNPPRYRYQYDFRVELAIANSPYFDEIEFKLNRDSVDIETNDFGNGNSLAKLLSGGREFDPESDPEYREYKKMCDELELTFQNGKNGTANGGLESGLKNGLGRIAEQRKAEETPAADNRPKFCPECGAPVEGGKFCGHCGSKL